MKRLSRVGSVSFLFKKVILKNASHSYTTDIKTCSRWFRQSTFKQQVEELEEIGLQAYKAKSTETLDSVLLAGYIKRKIGRIELGLIPESIKELLMYFMDQSYFSAYSHGKSFYRRKG